MTYDLRGIGFGNPADPDFDLYAAMGGNLDYAAWVQAGKPTVGGGNSDYYDENGYLWRYDIIDGWQRAGYDPTKAQSPATDSQPPTQYGLPAGYPEIYTDSQGRQYRWNPYKATYEESGYNPQSQAATPISPADQANIDLQNRRLEEERRQNDAMLAYYRERDAADQQQEQQKYLANLRANPTSWLEYSLAANQTPVIQPWMLPLMNQEYASLNGLKAGQAIPGWQGLPTTGGGGASTGGGPTTTGGGSTYTGTIPGGMSQGGMDALMTNAGITDPAIAAALINANRAVAGGSTGNAATLSPQDLAYLKQYMPSSYQAYIAQTVPMDTQRAFTEYIQRTGSNPYGNMSFAEGAKAWADAGGMNQPVSTASTAPVIPAGSPGTSTTTLQGTQTPPSYTPPFSSTDQGPPPSYYDGMTDEQKQTAMGYVGFANGGIAWGPTTAMIGENGPEAVVPLSGLTDTRYVNQPGGPGGMTVEGNPVGGLTDHRYVNQPQPVTGQSPTPSQPYNPVGGNGLPYLYNPSRQYQARMSPAMYQQYLGYEQMRTGATPQDIDWRLASMAPSTARYGLSYRR